jgi:tetratricopeptide (TPR) repeat protein
MKFSRRLLIIITLFFSPVLSLAQNILGLSEKVKNCDPGVVKIYTLNEYDQFDSQGSGCLISSDGVGITNLHVLAGARKAVALTANNKMYVIDKILDYNENSDLIKFKLENASALSYLKFRTSSISKGANVFAIGYPNGFEMTGESTVSTGIISGSREVEGIKMLQTSTPFTHGSSGGALFDEQGLLVGITAGTFVSDIKDRHANLNKVVPYAEINKLNRNLNISYSNFFNSIKDENLLARAMVYYESLDWGRAGLLFTEYLTQFPEDATVWFRNGLCNYMLLRETGREDFIQFAIYCFENAHELNKSYVYPCGQLAKLYLYLGRPDLADPWVLKCLNIDDEHSFTSYVVASYYGHHDVGKHDKSIEWFSKTLASGDKSINIDELYYEIGLQYAYVGDYISAIANYHVCLNINPNHETAMQQLSVVYGNHENYVFACETMTALQALTPNKVFQDYTVTQWKEYYCKKVSNTTSVNNIISGAYTSNQYQEFVWNQQQKKWVEVANTYINSKLYFESSTVSFAKGMNDWIGYRWYYTGFVDNKYCFINNKNYVLKIPSDFSRLEFFQLAFGGGYVRAHYYGGMKKGNFSRPY